MPVGLAGWYGPAGTAIELRGGEVPQSSSGAATVLALVEEECRGPAGAVGEEMRVREG
jgi:hypothetical protein